MKPTDRIAAAGLLQPQDLTPEEIELLDRELGPEEVDAIVRLGARLRGAQETSLRHVTFAF
jgi:hypothetical protein